MHIFSSPRNKIKVQEPTRLPHKYQSTTSLSATPAERKRFTVLLPQSVKTLFSKRTSMSLAPSPPQTSSISPRQAQKHLHTPEKIYIREPQDNSVRPTTARTMSAAITNVPRMETLARLQSASSTFPGHGRNSVYSPCDEGDASDDATGFSDRYSQARTKALAETVRRLQNTKSPGPLTPSSVSTGKTLPCFPEHEEEEYDEDNDCHPQDLVVSSTGEAARSRFSCIESRTGTLTASAISVTSLQRLAARSSRPSSMVVDTSCSRDNSIASIGSSAKSSSSSSSTLSPATSSSTHPQSVLNASDESLTPTLSETPRLVPAQSDYSVSKQEGAGCSVQQVHKSSKSDNAAMIDTEPSYPSSALEAKRQKYQQQRYSVAMSQNLSRRFQTRTTHEYEQRIYCLQAHHSDAVERMEARAQKDADHIRKLEEQLCELRTANTELCAKEADLTKKVQQLKNTKRASNSQSVATKPATLHTSSSSFALAHQANISKKLIEFMENYQEDVRRLKRETNTAQEWVVTLAELVVGPKKECQTWDEWLNSCLDTLQKRRERMKEGEWPKKAGWCLKNTTGMKSKQ